MRVNRNYVLTEFVLNENDCIAGNFRQEFKAGPPLEAILVIFGRRALIFFCLKALGKK